MRRFFIQPQDISVDQELCLDQDESRHISKVLRLQPGTLVELYDGTGFLYGACITDINKAVTVRIQTKRHFAPPQPELVLHAGLLKNKKMEMVLQKATELGVQEVHLFTSDHTSVTPPDQKKMSRFNKIIIESCKQCERLHPMHIFQPTPFADQLVATERAGSRYLFWEREEQNDLSMVGEIDKDHPLHLFIGPEGGFSKEEIMALPGDVKTISLGPNILRAETAVITGISIMAFLAGRFKL